MTFLFWEKGEIPAEYDLVADDVDWAILLPKGVAILPYCFDSMQGEIFYNQAADGRIVATCCHA